MAKTLHNSKGWLVYCQACKTHHLFTDGRWDFNGDVNQPTFSPSMLVHGDDPARRCHSIVRDGRIEYLADCGHAMAGQTAELTEI